MLTKEDKKFIVDLISGQINGLGARLDRVETRLDGVETRLDRFEIRLTDLTEKDRRNGFLLEHIDSVISAMTEADSVKANRVTVVEKKLENLTENELPAIRKTVSKHGLRLAKLEA